MARIFISYDRKDREIARTIEEGLLSEGHQSVWGVDRTRGALGLGRVDVSQSSGSRCCGGALD
jgi:hypothetical protein